ncbi:MAG TPA: TetR/AcrR family transcriptional regulator [Alphaproteobacteria bacterium]|nr:TetR/AcrR family transcriptional regulator [Alphaproteobacteria bacterium]
MEARRPYDIDSVTDVAFHVFAERGYDATSMDDVARAAGITKASIYHHVPSKEALLARGLNRALAALFGVLDEPEACAGTARARLAAIVRRVAEITMSLRAEVSVLFRVRGNSQTERDAMERRRAFDARITDLVREAQAGGEIRRDIEAALVVRLVFGMSNSVVEWYRPDGRTPAAMIAQAIEGIAFFGVAADWAQGPNATDSAEG